MITHLDISGLGVIRTAELDLAPGLVVFTGETGAGKTMLVSALGLVLGDRFDTGLLGADGTRVQATIDIPADSPALDRVRESGGAVDDAASESTEGTTGTAALIIGRHIPSGGRGRAVAGGATVPLSVLSDIGHAVAQRHSQSDQIGLRSARTQRHALDRYAGATLAEALGDYRTAYHRYLELSRRLADLSTADRDRTDRIARLRAELAEIDAIEPQIGEDDELTNGINRLSNAEALRDDVVSAVDAVTGDESGAITLLGAAAEDLQRASRHDTSLSTLAERLLAVQEQLTDAGMDLKNYAGSLASDPDQLARLQARKAQLTPLLRRFGPTAGAVVEHAESVRAELAAIDGGGEAIAVLTAEIAQVLTHMAERAEQVSQARRTAAQRLAEQVTGELAGLAMPQARFSVVVGHRDDPGGLTLTDGSKVAFGESGTDVVTFQLAPHPGAVPAAIGDGASGGELSRIMLALEVVLAESAPPSVFIFDEVDAGIGGRTAVEVGRRLARLAEGSQVLVVTHLPQVATFADQHIVVRKDSDGMVTNTSVTEVNGADRAAELSRMLSGQDDSAVALAHAEELLDLAAVEATKRRSTTRGVA